jgi:hypothetical protein
MARKDQSKEFILRYGEHFVENYMLLSYSNYNTYIQLKIEV